MTREKRQEQQEDSDEVAVQFAAALLRWNQGGNHRKMPWKGEKDPYKIWLSEIILQQTKVEQGLKYYEKFTSIFPDVHALAKARDEKIFKLWEGLGYYSRCRNLISTARYISEELDGVFPVRYESILQLKGVGSYTAAAIASFAYDQPYAVLDGNVFRVLSRILDVETAIDTSEGKKRFLSIAQSTLPRSSPGLYNQAIMDFGATICKPLPECHNCFFTRTCRAYLSGKQQSLPVKSKKIKTRTRWMYYFLVKYRDEIAIRQRVAKDIWQQLFECVLIEGGKSLAEKAVNRIFEEQFDVENYTVTNIFSVEQKLSHQTIHFFIEEMELQQKRQFPGYTWVKRSELNNYAFPRTLQQYMSAHLT